MKAIALAIPLILILVPLAGCLGDDGEGQVNGDDGEGQVYVYLKDAPPEDWTAVNIDITCVQAAFGGDEENEEAEEDEGGEGVQSGETCGPGNTNSWIVLWDENAGKTVNLLNFSGNASALLGNSTIPAGDYGQLMIFGTSVWGVDGEGEDIPITVPSFNQTGLKLNNGGFSIADGEDVHVVIDFKLDLMKKTGAGEWKITSTIIDVIVTETEPESEEVYGDDGEDQV